MTEGHFRHWLVLGIQLVKQSKDWSRKVKQSERLFHFSATTALFTIHFVLPTECLKQAIQSLIITITISSNVIGALTALFFTYHSVQLLMDSVIKQFAVITHL